MKRITKTFVIILLVMMMSPLTAFAVPGFLEVDLTPKNFNQYFEIVKWKYYDKSSGDYSGYSYVLKSKLFDKGYYLYDSKNFILKCTALDRWSDKYKNKTIKLNYKHSDSISFIHNTIFHHGKNSDYKYGKLSNFKIKKAKGKLIFIEPDNISEMRDYYFKDEFRGKTVILKQPYDDETYNEYHYDDNGNKVIDYYYWDLDFLNGNYTSNGKEEVMIR